MSINCLINNGQGFKFNVHHLPWSIYDSFTTGNDFFVLIIMFLYSYNYLFAMNQLFNCGKIGIVFYGIGKVTYVAIIRD